MKTRTKLLIASLAFLPGIVSPMPSAKAQNLLVDPDFNGTPPLSTIANVLGPPFVTGLWGPENGAIVGVDGGVTPLSAPTMLAEYAPGTGLYTQTAQATNVSSYPAGTAFTLSANFDANQALPAADAFVNMSFYDSSYNLLASPPSVGLILDNNPSTWEPISVTAIEPPSTEYVLSQVLYDNNSLQVGTPSVYYPSYVDNAALTVPEPSTFALLGAGAAGLLGFVWRRRRRARGAVYTNSNWIADFPAAQAASSPYPVYALSSPITAPEPSTFALLGAGAIGLVAYRCRQRRQKRSSSPENIDRPLLAGLRAAEAQQAMAAGMARRVAIHESNGLPRNFFC